MATKKASQPKTKIAQRKVGRTERAVKQDLSRKAEKEGKRKSASGEIYYEYRTNRTDLGKRNKKKRV